MEKLTLLETFEKSNEYQRMLPKDRVQYRKKKLYDLVMYAKDNSPLYKQLYEGLNVNFTIKDLPTTNRAIINNNYDLWATDPGVSEDSLKAFMDENPEGNKKYLGKYYVVSTSGSYEDALVCLHDEMSARMMSIEFLKKCFARREHFWGFIFHGSRIAGIYSDVGHFWPNVFANMRKANFRLRKNKSIMLSASQATSGLVNTLNEYKPTMLNGFPSALIRMADEKKVSRLKITPTFIIADGEPLSEEQRKIISEVFKCDVTSTYSSAMTGCIAYECREHHLHINDDRIILEAIDEQGNPVKPGQASDKILVTNLMNYVQPVIRYEIGDRVIVHDEECLCGNVSPWIEIVGKNLDQIFFNEGGREILIPVKELESILGDADYIKRYQIIVYPNAHLALRITGAKKVDKTMAFFKAEKALRTYLKSRGLVAPMITLEKDEPKPHPLSGKYQTIIVE